MMVLQLCGAYGIPCPAMVSPNAGLAQRGTSCCTRMITLYGAPKLDSGPHISLPFLVDLPL